MTNMHLQHIFKYLLAAYRARDDRMLYYIRPMECEEGEDERALEGRERELG